MSDEKQGTASPTEVGWKYIRPELGDVWRCESHGSPSCSDCAIGEVRAAWPGRTRRASPASPTEVDLVGACRGWLLLHAIERDDGDMLVPTSMGAAKALATFVRAQLRRASDKRDASGYAPCVACGKELRTVCSKCNTRDLEDAYENGVRMGRAAAGLNKSAAWHLCASRWRREALRAMAALEVQCEARLDANKGAACGCAQAVRDRATTQEAVARSLKLGDVSDRPWVRGRGVSAYNVEMHDAILLHDVARTLERDSSEARPESITTAPAVIPALVSADPQPGVGDLVKRAVAIMRGSKRGEVSVAVKLDDGTGWAELTLPEMRGRERANHVSETESGRGTAAGEVRADVRHPASDGGRGVSGGRGREGLVSPGSPAAGVDAGAAPREVGDESQGEDVLTGMAKAIIKIERWSRTKAGKKEIARLRQKHEDVNARYAPSRSTSDSSGAAKGEP